MVAEASDPTTSGVLWSRLAKLFTLLSLTNPTYESHEKVDRAMAQAKEETRPAFPEDHLLKGIGVLGKQAEQDTRGRGNKWRGMIKDARQQEEEEIMDGVRRILSFYELRNWLCRSPDTKLVLEGEEEKVVIGEKKVAGADGTKKNGLLLVNQEDAGDVKGEKDVGDEENEEEEEEEEAKRKMMRNMAHLWLQQEVHELECDSVRRNGGGGGGGTLRGFAHYSPYVVVDHLALSKRLALVKEVVASRKFAVVVPTAVIQILDEMKKEDGGARTAIRWLEKQFRDGEPNAGFF